MFHGDHYAMTDRLGTTELAERDKHLDLPRSIERAVSVEKIVGEPSDGERRVLIIASRFPPVASVGAIRVRKFTKYLRRHGWRPYVITGAMRRATANSQDARRATDMQSLDDIPSDTLVHRLNPVMDYWPSHATRAVSTRLAKLTQRIGWDTNRWQSALLWRFKRLHDGLSFPDRGIWRLPGAVRAAVQLHRRHRFDAVFTSGMPFSDHLIGLAVHSILRLPWLVDFRDPWAEYIHWQQWKTTGGQRLTHWAEAAVIRRASHVISVNDAMTSRFVDRYGDPTGAKFVTIPNGFDPADFPTDVVDAPSSEFRLLYAGSLYKTRSPETVLRAFRQFVDETPGAAQRARFDFAGRSGPFVAELSDRQDEGRVRYLGMLPHSETLGRMASADVNVILLPNMPGSATDTTAKIYECLGSGRAILAAVPPYGAAAKELRGFDGVWVCDPDDPSAMVQALGDMYRRWLSGDLHTRRSPGQLHKMTRPYQARLLADHLNATVGRHTRDACATTGVSNR
ncbi:MAG: glycosyltransferase [Planctomycetota bacterium]